VRCNEDCDPCCGVEEWRHEFVCRACQRPRGMGSAIMRAASLVPNRPGCEQGDQTETHALSRSRSAILVSEYFVFLSRSATLQKKKGHRADLLRRRRSGKRQSKFLHWPACFLCAPRGLQRPHFDGPFFSVFNNLGDQKLTLASKHRILSCSCVTFLGILHLWLAKILSTCEINSLAQRPQFARLL